MASLFWPTLYIPTDGIWIQQYMVVVRVQLHFHLREKQFEKTNLLHVNKVMTSQSRGTGDATVEQICHRLN